MREIINREKKKFDPCNNQSGTRLCVYIARDPPPVTTIPELHLPLSNPYVGGRFTLTLVGGALFLMQIRRGTRNV